MLRLLLLSLSLSLPLYSKSVSVSLAARLQVDFKRLLAIWQQLYVAFVMACECGGIPAQYYLPDVVDFLRGAQSGHTMQDSVMSLVSGAFGLVLTQLSTCKLVLLSLTLQGALAFLPKAGLYLLLSLQFSCLLSALPLLFFWVLIHDLVFMRCMFLVLSIYSLLVSSFASSLSYSFIFRFFVLHAVLLFLEYC